MLPEFHSVLELLERGFGQFKILVVGDIMLDRYIIGEVERISPEAPVPVLLHAERYERPGGAANVAMNLAGLGCQAILAGFWGSDGEQAELVKLLEPAGVDTVGVVTSSLPTISKTRIVARTQQVMRLDIESRESVPAEERERLQARAVELVTKVHAVILSDYAKGVLTRSVCEAVIGAAKAAGIPVLVDPKTEDFSKYSGATTVCPNLQELSAATEVPSYRTEDLLRVARAQMAEHDIRNLTVTMSEKGITNLGPEGDFHSPARAREVFDVSGAGDTVIATLAAWAGWEPCRLRGRS
jgi:D-beta-D-heptose 7-phosphate kinase/D-beta-D-heptose 1-phosphate adenosyltransferase